MMREGRFLDGKSKWFMEPEDKGSKDEQHSPELSGDPEHGNSGPGGPLPEESDRPERTPQCDE